jgi:hypothetical protein
MRLRLALVLALSAVLLVPFPGAAQTRDTVPARQPTRAVGQPLGTQSRIGTPNYDVVLEVPELSVDSIGLTVANLRAHLALDANVANLVSLTAGVDVAIDRVELQIAGVVAEAYVYVDLDNVARIADRVLTTLDNNPALLTQVLATVDSTVNTVGGVANTVLQPGGVAGQAVGAVGRTLDNASQPGGLLSQTVNTLGQTVQRTVDATGSIVERTLDASGRVVGTRGAGSLLDLPVVRETAGAAGQTTRQVRDASGAVVELTLDRAGRVVASRVLQQAGRRP